MKKIISYLLLLFKVTVACSQQNDGLKFIETVNGDPVVLNQWFALGQEGDSMNITKLKFYTSQFKIKNKGSVIRQNWPETKLIDGSLSSHSIGNVAGVFDQLEFLFGIDSLLQESGAQSGELDPLKGMYWTWQSGYIHFKLEGNLRLKDHSDQDVILHLGGYRYPYNTLQKISLMHERAVGSMVVNLDLDELLQHISQKKIYHIMSPGPSALALSELLANSFKIAF